MAKTLSITLNELKRCSVVSEAIDHMVSKEVEGILRRSLPEQRKYFKNYLKIDMRETIIDWKRIDEAMERRNIIVHNNGVVNRRYLNNIDMSVIPEKKNDLKEGKTIAIREDYFGLVLDELYVVGIILTQSCWRKWKTDAVDKADTRLIISMYEPLRQEKWAVAERLGLFSRECETYDERNRLYLDINYCQSLKWHNKRAQLQKELRKFDVSSLSPMYLVALSALKSDRDSFYGNIRKAIIVDKMEKEAFMEWPLFREFRKDPDYEKKIKRAFVSASRKGRD